MVSGLRFPDYPYPRGWYQIGYTSQLDNGEPLPVHYFGEDLVAFKGESGKLGVLTSYCQHMGMNLAVRGKIIGDDIRCPWHGWQWDGDGRNTLIPYSKEKCKPNVRIRSWPVRRLLRHAHRVARLGPDSSMTSLHGSRPSSPNSRAMTTTH